MNDTPVSVTEAEGLSLRASRRPLTLVELAMAGVLAISVTVPARADDLPPLAAVAAAIGSTVGTTVSAQDIQEAGAALAAAGQFTGTSLPSEASQAGAILGAAVRALPRLLTPPVLWVPPTNLPLVPPTDLRDYPDPVREPAAAPDHLPLPPNGTA